MFFHVFSTRCSVQRIWNSHRTTLLLQVSESCLNHTHCTGITRNSHFKGCTGVNNWQFKTRLHVILKSNAALHRSGDKFGLTLLENPLCVHTFIAVTLLTKVGISLLLFNFTAPRLAFGHLISVPFMIYSVFNTESGILAPLFVLV